MHTALNLGFIFAFIRLQIFFYRNLRWLTILTHCLKYCSYYMHLISSYLVLKILLNVSCCVARFTFTVKKYYSKVQPVKFMVHVTVVRVRCNLE